MDDRRRTRDLHHFAAWRDIAERALRIAIVIGAVVGWAAIGHVLRTTAGA